MENIKLYRLLHYNRKMDNIKLYRTIIKFDFKLFNNKEIIDTNKKASSSLNEDPKIKINVLSHLKKNSEKRKISF